MLRLNDVTFSFCFIKILEIPFSRTCVVYYIYIEPCCSMGFYFFYYGYDECVYLMFSVLAKGMWNLHRKLYTLFSFKNVMSTYSGNLLDINGVPCPLRQLPCS